MRHTDLVGFYERLFAFCQYHGWSLEEIYDHMPWEFDVMTSLLSNYLEKLVMDRKQAANGGGQSF